LSSVQPPPIYEKLSDNAGKSTLPWVLFFNNIFQGDTGTDWTPQFTDLTVSGTPTITGRVYRLSRRIAFFRATVTPATNTSAVAGTTYINNFPLTFTNDGICFAVSGGLGTGSGHVIASNNRIFVPAWTTVTVPVTVVGMGEVRA
jgi:hypothetical protein